MAARLALCIGFAAIALGALSRAYADDVGPAGEAVVTLDAEVLAAVSLEGDATRGAHAYQRCSVCHQPSGVGRPDGTFPQLAGQHRSVIIKQLVDVRKRNRDNPVMEPHARELLDAQDIADVATYVEALPVPDGRRTGDGGDLERGAMLYRRDCVDCHGERGEGSPERFIPVLAHQHYPYLLRRIRAIAAGRSGNAHSGMEDRIHGYSDGELRAVVDHASRLAGPIRQPSR